MIYTFKQVGTTLQLTINYSSKYSSSKYIYIKHITTMCYSTTFGVPLRSCS